MPDLPLPGPRVKLKFRDSVLKLKRATRVSPGSMDLLKYPGRVQKAKSPEAVDCLAF